MGIKVSVIVPVYNVEKYLRKCLDSIINQTLKDIEIIVVNDGSTDSSLSICEEYAEKDERIILISKENAGLSHTRNTGLKIAKGEYISFIDSDDYIEKNMLQTLYDLGQKSSADIIFCNNDIINVKRFKCKSYPYPTGKTVYASEFKKNIDYFLNGYIMTVWRKIYRKDFLSLNSIWFDDTVMFQEDIPFTTLCMEKAESICGTDEVLYHYILRDGSITNTYFLKLLDILRNLNKEILENYEKMSNEEFQDYIYRYFRSMKKFPYKKMTRKEKIRLIKIVRETDYVNSFFTQSAETCPNLNIKN
ncbi:MAG: glycosyltransferase, partial [Armatimonadetes bacterium]|nr:glycosyltransferase [Candidatus Hippobium faecium]